MSIYQIKLEPVFADPGLDPVGPAWRTPPAALEP
jgi:hypothetical protein